MGDKSATSGSEQRDSGRVGALDDPALARHDGLARSEVAPARRQREVVARHVAAADGGRYGDCGGLRARCTRRNAENWGV